MGASSICCFFFPRLLSACGDSTRFEVHCVVLLFSEKNICYQMSSFNESVALGCLKQAPVEFVKYPSCPTIYLLLPLYGYYTGQPLLSDTSRCVKKQPFCWSKVLLLLTATSPCGLGRKC